MNARPILAAVAQATGVRAAVLRGKDTDPEYSAARQMACLLLRERGVVPEAVARALDCAVPTVAWRARRAAWLQARDPVFAAALNRARALIRREAARVEPARRSEAQVRDRARQDLAEVRGEPAAARRIGQRAAADGELDRRCCERINAAWDALGVAANARVETVTMTSAGAGGRLEATTRRVIVSDLGPVLAAGLAAFAARHDEGGPP